MEKEGEVMTRKMGGQRRRVERIKGLTKRKGGGKGGGKGKVGEEEEKERDRGKE